MKFENGRKQNNTIVPSFASWEWGINAPYSLIVALLKLAEMHSNFGKTDPNSLRIKQGNKKVLMCTYMAELPTLAFFFFFLST